MVLYHVITIYQLICAIIHRRIYHHKTYSILIVADFLAISYPQLGSLSSEFFDDCIIFRYSNIEHDKNTIHDSVSKEYQLSVGYNIEEFDNVYILGAHFYFTDLLISKRIHFSCFEEAPGMLEEFVKLSNIVMKKYPVQADWAKKNGLFDLSCLYIKEIYCLKDLVHSHRSNLIDFNVMTLLHQVDVQFRSNLISLFLPHKYKGGKEKSILITEHFSNLGFMTKKQQELFYRNIISDICDEELLIIKPHPSDELDYHKIFPKAEILGEKFPSEFLPYIFEENPSVILTIGSTAVKLLEPYYVIRYIGVFGKRQVNYIYQYPWKEENYKMNNYKKEYIQPAYSRNNIPLAISCSNEYVKYLSVLLQSIMDHSSVDNNYDILILNKGIEKRNQNLIEKQCCHDNVSVRFVSTNEYIQNGGFYTEGLSIEAYFRMFLTDIMYNYDKTLYLDVDTYVLTDIADLYNIDIGDSYIAACIDINIVASYILGNHWKPYIDKILELDHPYEYVQSGVMVLNLRQLRKDFSFDYLIKLSKEKEWRLYDQDVLNYMCKNNIYFLDPSYNVIDIQEGRKENIKKNAPEELQRKFFEARTQPKIIHFVGKKKPWISFNTEFSEYFWESARKTPFYESILISRINKVDLRTFKLNIADGNFKNNNSAFPIENSKKVLSEKVNFSFVQNEELEKQKKVSVFRCESIYQLLNAIVIKQTLLEDTEADLILTKATNFDTVYSSLKEAKIFRNVVISEDTPQTYLDWRGMSKSEQKKIYTEPEKYILPIDVSGNYSDYYIAVADEYNKIFYYYLLKQGLRPKIHIFEDGMNSYILNNVALCKNDFIQHSFYGEFSFDKNIVEHLVYQPSCVVEQDPQIIYTVIPKIDGLDTKIKLKLENIFGRFQLPDEKYIFMEEAFLIDGIASTDMELLEQIAEIVGKNNIIVKLHPRNTVDRFSPRGFKIMEQTTVPWEVVLLNSNVSQKVFLTISSTAALSAGISFNKEFTSIYMYKIMTLGTNIHVRQKKFKDFFQLIKNFSNKKRLQVMVPNSLEELKEELIYLERGIEL